MENNKAYLQKIHWVFLLAIAWSVYNTFFDSWIIDTDSWLMKILKEEDNVIKGKLILLVSAFISFIPLYTALGIATSRWKEALIAFATAMVVEALRLVFIKKGFNFTYHIIHNVVYTLPLFVFIALQTGWQKKLWVVYIAAFIVITGFSAGYHAPLGIDRNFRLLTGRGFEEIYDVLVVVFRTAGLIFLVIAACEILNYVKGKTYTNKSVLINLGNNYTRLNALITFWTLKAMLLVFIFGSGVLLSGFIDAINLDAEKFAGEAREWITNMKRFNLTIASPQLISFICMALFLAWYLRKFLIEWLTGNDIRSKFLYWLLTIPVIGFFAFIILLFTRQNQQGYRKRLDALTGYADSRSAAITTIIFIALFIRFAFRIAEGEAASIISIIISMFLFLWLMTSRAGYYTTLVLTGTAFLVVLVLSLVMNIPERSENAEILPLLNMLLTANLIQLVLIYPVYHFEEFQYIPAEDPEPVIPPFGKEK
jgi:hypothetical protein